LLERTCFAISLGNASAAWIAIIKNSSVLFKKLLN